MTQRDLGKTSLRVSPIGLGGMGFVARSMSRDRAEALIRRALELGVNLFDTARGYYDSERILGLALRPGEGIIASKSFLRSAGGIRKELAESLRMLRRDSLDIYQVHHIQYRHELEQILRADGALGALAKARSEGLVRFIGVSGHRPQLLLECLDLGVFDLVQFPFNPIEQDAFSPVLDKAQTLGIGTLVMKPFAGGALRNTDACLRFALSFPVSSVLVGCSSIQELESDVAVAGSAAVVAPEELARVKEEIRALDEPFCRRCRYCESNCPQGIPVSEVFRAESYLIMNATYARDEYRRLGRPATRCEACGQCEERCPYRLPVREMLRRAHERLTRGKLEDAAVKVLRRLGLYDVARRIYFRLGGPLPKR